MTETPGSLREALEDYRDHVEDEVARLREQLDNRERELDKVDQFLGELDGDDDGGEERGDEEPEAKPATKQAKMPG
jgi:hypothetical protein